MAGGWIPSGWELEHVRNVADRAFKPVAESVSRQSHGGFSGDESRGPDAAIKLKPVDHTIPPWRPDPGVRGTRRTQTVPESRPAPVALTPGEAPFGTATLTITEAATLLGVGRNLAYEVAARDGELAGVPVIRVGRRRLVPHARLLTSPSATSRLPASGTLSN